MISPERKEENIDNQVEKVITSESSKDKIEAENAAKKITEKTSIKEGTVEELTGTKLNILKENLDLVEKEKSSPEKIVSSENNYELIDNKLQTDKQKENTFSPFEIKENDSIIKQNTEALVYSGKTIGKFAYGLGKGILNTPRDIYLLAIGKATYKAPSLPDKFA